MVDTFVNSTVRDEVGSNACHKIRSQGHVPGVIYGHHFANYPLELDQRELSKIIRQQGENAMVSVNVNGTNYPAMVKDIQRDILSDEIIHVDLQQIDNTEKIQVTIPILLSGKERLGNMGVLQQQLQKIDVECYPDQIPKSIPIDIGSLALGKSLKVSDVEFGDEFTVLNDAQAIIASIAGVQEEIEEQEEEDLGYSFDDRGHIIRDEVNVIEEAEQE